MATKLSEDDIAAELSTTKGWTRDGDEISRKVESRDFKEALLLINAVGHFAEQANHHPKIANVYKWTTFTLSTHDADGLTVKDFELARKINALL